MAGMELISRARWGAKYEAGSGARPLPTTECWLHHTVTLAPDLAFEDLNRDSTDDDEAKAMRTIEQIGEDRFGRGFSYNAAIMPSGRIYEGCGVDRVGAHTGGRNTRAFGLCLVGNYEANPLPDTMKAAIVDFLREGHRLGWIDRPAFDGGHRDLKATSCPGGYAYRLIPTFNSQAATPAPAPAPAPSPAFPVPPSIARGAEGDLVKYLQSLLVFHRHDLSQEGGVDGDFGPGLERELKAYQAARKLPGNGVCGPGSWRSLQGIE